MAILLKVKWIDKSDHPELHQRVGHIGGSSREFQWQHTQAQAIESIERGEFAYYVIKDVRALKLDVALTADGKKYLTIQAGNGHPQLPLDSCG
jgi:hypothetical protein